MPWRVVVKDQKVFSKELLRVEREFDKGFGKVLEKRSKLGPRFGLENGVLKCEAG